MRELQRRGFRRLYWKDIHLWEPNETPNQFEVFYSRELFHLTPGNTGRFCGPLTYSLYIGPWREPSWLMYTAMSPAPLFFRALKDLKKMKALKTLKALQGQKIGQKDVESLHLMYTSQPWKMLGVGFSRIPRFVAKLKRINEAQLQKAIDEIEAIMPKTR